MKNLVPLFILSILIFMPGRTYCQLAKGQKKFVGNVIGGHIPSDFLYYWNQVTPENAGKWGNVEFRKDDFAWGTLDKIYNFAHEKKSRLNFTTLSGENNNPDGSKALIQRNKDNK
jgi:endo-1,4-beta-xylanase